MDVYVFSVPGNHSRCLPLKEENMKGENLDHLVFWYLEAAMHEYQLGQITGIPSEYNMAMM